MHFLWCVRLVTFILRNVFQLHIKFLIKIYILHPSSSRNDTFLKNCFIFCVWGWGGGGMFAEKWVFILISKTVAFFVSFKCTAYSMVFGGGVQCCTFTRHCNT